MLVLALLKYFMLDRYQSAKKKERKKRITIIDRISITIYCVLRNSIICLSISFLFSQLFSDTTYITGSSERKGEKFMTLVSFFSFPFVVNNSNLHHRIM